MTNISTAIAQSLQNLPNISLIEEMYIDREDYLNLLNKVDLLQQDNKLLTTENQILVAELERQKHLNYELLFRMDSIKEHSQVVNDKLVNQNEALHHDLKGYIGVLDQKQRKYLDSQFQQLEKSAFQKYRVLQIKNTVNRIENHELLQFLEKIKKIYKKTWTQQKQPSLKDMIKWIKSISFKQSEHQHHYSSGLKAAKKTDDTGSSWKHSKVK